MTSLSLYRGQARQGIGEGTGESVFGEQYLAIDDDLRGNGSIFEAARSWMTLDARDSDHQQLADQLEAWSLFQHGDYTAIVRMVTNPHFRKYDKRAAYFAHARFWLGTTRHVTSHFGQASLFDEPAPDAMSLPDAHSDETASIAEVPPKDPEQAIRFLAQMMQAHLFGYPLIVVAELEDFARNASLLPIVSFALAAMPKSLKAKARIRFFTSTPRLFLSHLGATVVVVLKRDAPDALKAADNVILLDREGNQGRGPTLHSNIDAYARAVVGRALKLPSGLLPFTERVDEFIAAPEPPNDLLRSSIVALYNIAYATQHPEKIGRMIRKSIAPQIARGHRLLPVDRLLPAHEQGIWSDVADTDLIGLVLDDDLPSPKLDENPRSEGDRGRFKAQVSCA
ncbi:MAG: hypothetical protein HN348_12275, partial [Proteobacteria bacterium]|nr:hypothetical protein [Pseudomonadota bacterium]